MKDLRLETQGVKGGNTKTVEKNGFIMVNCGEHRVTFDNFTGQGETYKQRENPLIEIIENGQVAFSGSFAELSQLLKDVKQIADYIQTDIDAENIEDDDRFAFDTYKKFADKYNN